MTSHTYLQTTATPQALLLQDSQTPYNIERNYPALLMFRNMGTLAKGWDGEPFWIPVIRFPDGNYAFSVNES